MSPVAEPPLTAPSGTSSGAGGVPRPQSGPGGSEARSPPDFARAEEEGPVALAGLGPPSIRRHAGHG